jgi:hypothetical protein
MKKEAVVIKTQLLNECFQKTKAGMKQGWALNHQIPNRKNCIAHTVSH